MVPTEAVLQVPGAGCTGAPPPCTSAIWCACMYTVCVAMSSMQSLGKVVLASGARWTPGVGTQLLQH